MQELRKASPSLGKEDPLEIPQKEFTRKMGILQNALKSFCNSEMFINKISSLA